MSAIQGHQAAFQSIADQNGGIRSSLDGTHDATADHVRARMLGGRLIWFGA